MRVLVAIVVLAIPGRALAQEAIVGPITHISFAGYTGAGLVPDPGPGQLDSDSWAVTGMNDGDTSFGGSFTGGDFGEGASPGGISGDGTGGLWAFSVVPGDPAFGIQQSGEDLTPGHIYLRFVNATSAPIVSPTVRFEGWTWNDSTRASIIELSWSLDGSAFQSVPGADITTGEAPDATPSWHSILREARLDGVTLAPNALLIVRWSPDALSGSGGFDELAIDDIEVDSPVPSSPPDAGVTFADASVSDTDGGVEDPPAEDRGYTANGCSSGGGASPIVVLLALLAVHRRKRFTLAVARTPRRRSIAVVSRSSR